LPGHPEHLVELAELFAAHRASPALPTAQHIVQRDPSPNQCWVRSGPHVLHGARGLVAQHNRKRIERTESTAIVHIGVADAGRFDPNGGERRGRLPESDRRSMSTGVLACSSFGLHGKATASSDVSS
jgi:hypothetical protein